MASNVSIRLFETRYAKVFRDLNLEWIQTHFSVEQKDLDQVDHPEECLAGGGQIFFVVLENEAVGTCALYRHGQDSFELAKMAVDPRYRGRGLGDLLMTAAEKWAWDQGARRLLILSNTVLKPAIHLYEKHGYRIDHLGSHPDYARCNIVMSKQLSPPAAP